MIETVTPPSNGRRGSRSRRIGADYSHHHAGLVPAMMRSFAALKVGVLADARLLCAPAPRRSSMTTSPVGMPTRTCGFIWIGRAWAPPRPGKCGARSHIPLHVSAHAETRYKGTPSPMYLAIKPPIRSRHRRSFVDARSLPDSTIDSTKSQHITVSWRRRRRLVRWARAAPPILNHWGTKRAMSVPCRAMMISRQRSGCSAPQKPSLVS